MSDAYEIVYFRGKRFDRMTAQALSKMEEKLGYTLTIYQGSYSSSVGASAGTHNGGGAVDLAGADHFRKVRVGRQIGFAMWYRSPSEGPWVAHVHGILIGNDRAHWSAKQQVEAYRNHRNGLASNGADTHGWWPNPIKPYRYEVDKAFPINLHNVRVDFINAIDGGKNKPRRGVRLIQRVLNRKLNLSIPEDGIAGPRTVDAWQKWERRVGVSGRSGVPDRKTLRKLLRYTIYFIK